MSKALVLASGALLLGGCALLVGIEDHTLATSTTTTTTTSAGGSSATTTSSAAAGAGGQGAGGQNTGGEAPDNCPPPDLGLTACPAGKADCDGDGTCEATLATDGKNCGFCHHDCLGGACEGSVCRGVALTTPYDPGQAFGPMIVHQGKVYFAAGPHEANMVWSVPVDGGAPAKVVSSGTVGEVYHLAAYVNVQTTYLFATAHDTGKWVLHGMLADGGTPNDVAPLESFSVGLAVDGDGVQYVAEKSHIVAVAGTPKVIVASPDPLRGLAADGQYVYWSSYPDAGGASGRVSKTSLKGFHVVEELVSGLGRPTQLTLDDAWVYWADLDLGTVSRTLKSGGAVETLVTGQLSPKAVAVLGDDVFWTADDGLYRARLCALGKAPVRLTHNPAFALAADGKRVVVTDTYFHQVMSYAR